MASNKALRSRNLPMSLDVGSWLLAMVAAGGVGYGVFRANSTHPTQFKAWKTADASGLDESVPASAPKVVFTDVTDASGLTFKHHLGAYGRRFLPETVTGGGGFVDVDSDGDPDLVLVSGGDWEDGPPEKRHVGPRVAIFLNDGKGNFEDATKGSGLEKIDFYGQGLATADIDADGYLDLFFTGLRKNYLFRNKGDGTFEDVTKKAGVGKSPWSMASVFFDYDRDGDLDLMVGNYVEWSPERNDAALPSNGGRGMSYPGPVRFPGEAMFLYRNDGDFRFTDVSEEAKVVIRDDNTGADVGRTLALSVIDIDGDGDEDVFVANDMSRNFLLINKGDGTFDEVGREAGLAWAPTGRATSGMGMDVAYYRNSTELAVAVGNFHAEPSSLFVGTPNKENKFEDLSVAEGFGAATYEDVSFGVFFFDYDLDGRLDLFQANGGVDPVLDNYQAGTAAQLAGYRKHSYRHKPQLFWNCGDECGRTFVMIPQADTQGFDQELVGRAAAYADIDGDGDLDVLVTQSDDRARLYRNDQDLGHHYLRVRVVGPAPNVRGVGATVTLVSDGVEQWRRVDPTRSYLSLVEFPVTFGLGANPKVDSLTVRWPDGTTQPVKVDAFDRTIEVVHPKAKAAPQE